MKLKQAWRVLAVACVGIAASAFAFPRACAAEDLEVSGGYTHVTSDFGTDGFNLGAGWFFAPRFEIAGNYDDAWDTSRIGDFEFTSLGVIVSKTHLQNFMVGPRYFFDSQKIGNKNSNHRIIPFAELQFGVTHLHQEIQQQNISTAVNEDSAFSWMVGGGVDYPLASHWVARGGLDLLRTHLNAEGQSRLRVALSLAYTWDAR
jgi:hypothetical protein